MWYKAHYSACILACPNITLQGLQLHTTCAQVECPAVTPEAVLKASGHVDRFTDFMVTDTVTGDCHRADHLLKAALEALLDDPKSGLTPEKRRVRCSCAASFLLWQTCPLLQKPSQSSAT